MPLEITLDSLIEVIKTIFMLGVAVIGYLLKRSIDAQDAKHTSLASNQKELADDFNTFVVQVNQNFATKSDVAKTESRIDTILMRMEDKLDRLVENTINRRS